MAQQQALLLEKANGDFSVGSTDIPKPGSADLLVKIHATALNPVDWKIQKTEYSSIISHYPAVLGLDAAGTVEAIGEQVRRFAVGDRVLFQGGFSNDKATFQQYTTVPAEIAAKIPSNVSFDEAASVPSGLATAAIGLYGDRSSGGPEKLVAPWDESGENKYQGKPLVAFGGSSSVGQYVIQLARLSGFSPIITTASPHNAALLKTLGATHVLDRNANSDSLVQEIKAITGDTPVEVVYDAVAASSTQELAWDILAPGGQLILVQAPTVNKDKYKDKHLVHFFGSVQAAHNRPLGVRLYGRLTELLENGSIRPNRVEVLPNGLRGIPDGAKRLGENKVSGVKLIARPLETK